MASKSSEPETLKSLLIKHLKGEPVKYKAMSLEAKVGAHVQLTDNNGYFFLSKNLKKECANVTSKSVIVTLKNWSFVSGGKIRKGTAPKVEIEAETVQVKPMKAEFELKASAKNLLEYKEIQKIWESAAAAPEKEKEVKVKVTERAKAVVAVTKAKAAPQKKEEIIKKIAKASKNEPTSKSDRKVQFNKEALASPKPKSATLKLKNPMPEKSEDSESEDQGVKTNGRSAQNHFSDNYNSDKYIHFEVKISPEDLIEAPEYIPTKRKASVTKSFKLSPTKKSQFNLNEAKKVFLNQKQRYELSSVISQIPKSSVLAYREEVNPLNRHGGLDIKEILMGVYKGKLSWNEISFHHQTLEYVDEK
jgi:hypothetical protein